MKIGIDAGHGINTAGKRCAKEFDVNETREWLLNSRVATKVCDLLRQYGVETLRLDDITGNTDIGLNTRVRNANSANVDFVLSIHHNAGGGTGIETFVYNQACLNGKSGEIARVLQAKAVEKTDMRDRGVKLGNFAIIRDTKMPACLIECGFMDNANDTPRILTEEYANIVANALVEAIVEYFGLIKQDGQTVVENATVGENQTAKEQIDVDGRWGQETTRKAQKVFGTPVDGIVSNQHSVYKDKNKGLLGSSFDWKENPSKNGSVLIGAIQETIGVKKDGFIGPKTIRGMQKWLGTTVDGYVSDPSAMVRAFQEWLNAQ